MGPRRHRSLRCSRIPNQGSQFWIISQWVQPLSNLYHLFNPLHLALRHLLHYLLQFYQTKCLLMDLAPFPQLLVITIQTPRRNCDFLPPQRLPRRDITSGNDRLLHLRPRNHRSGPRNIRRQKNATCPSLRVLILSLPSRRIRGINLTKTKRWAHVLSANVQPRASGASGNLLNLSSLFFQLHHSSLFSRILRFLERIHMSYPVCKDSSPVITSSLTTTIMLSYCISHVIPLFDDLYSIQLPTLHMSSYPLFHDQCVVYFAYYFYNAVIAVTLLSKMQ